MGRGKSAPKATAFLDLTDMQKAYVAAYLETWNKVKAARAAGYSDPVNSGSKVFNTHKIQAALAEQLKLLGLDRFEVLARLAQMARANIADFIVKKIVTRTDKQGNSWEEETIALNWDTLQKYGYLIKRLSFTNTGMPVIELHDSQVALVNIGKNLGLFGDSVDVNLNGAVKGYISISPDDWDEQK